MSQPDWEVEIVEENGKFTVRTTRDSATTDMEFQEEGFALLYAKGQRIHYEVLHAIGKDEESSAEPYAAS